MTRILIPLALFIFSATLSFAQTPNTIIIPPSGNTQGLSVACPPGANPDGGTSTQALFASAESNDVLYLCMGDSMDVMHFGGDLSGDPQPVSAPGFSYVFYDCPPTVTGPTSSDILTDPCHIVVIPGTVTAVQDNIDINGNATFYNQGQIQTVLNGGAPMEVWYAPVTLDDFNTFGFEPDGTGEVGPCINVNVADAFSVTYLNSIQAANINNAVNGFCLGSFNVTGGLPEFDGSTYTNISITLSTDPTVEADINGANFTHNDLIEFNVPQSGIYNVLVEDDKSCAASFTIDMTACPDIVFDAGDEFGTPGSIVCVEIDVSDFTDVLSFQYTISWDPSILQLESTMPLSVNNLGALADINFGPAMITDALTVSWFDSDFSGESLANGTGIFEICFELIGPPGSTSPITFSGDLTQIEVLGPDPGGNFPFLGFIGNAGSVTVAGDLTVVFTSCSSLSGGPDVGTFNLTVTGGIPPYSYDWFNIGMPGINGSGGILFNGGTDIVGDNLPGGDNPLPPGTYQVTVTDDVGVMQIANVEIFDAEPLVVSLTETPPTCFDSPDGYIILDTANLGGFGTPSIVWSTMETDVDSIGGLISGVYTVTVTDIAGCQEVDQVSLMTPLIVVDTVNLQHVSCNGPGNDGLIIVSASGGVINPGNDYSYAWSNGFFGPNINNLTPGNYCVSVTDDNNCEVVHCIDVNAGDPPVVVSWDSISVDCPTDLDGSLTVNVVPGNAAIDSYTWDPAQPGANETISGIGAGTYYVTITATDGCMTVDSASLFAPMPMVYDSSQTVSPNCPGDNNGSVTVFVSGGTGPYTYTWNTGAVSNFPLLPGLVGDSTYTVTVTDSGNCGDIVIQDIFLANPPAITVQFIDLMDVTCNGGLPCDGEATAIASGGTAGTGDYNFNWQSGEASSGGSQSTAMQLCEGPMVLEVNDGLCSVTVDTIIGSPAALSVNIDNTMSVPASCFGASDGGATVEGDGGIPGYTYQWTNPNVNGPSISGVPAGDYNVVITDANGCTFPFVIEVGEPDSLVATISGQMDANCADGNDGMLEVSWTGGNPGNATYSWTNNVSNSSTANNLPSGTYTVTVTDQNGCNDIATGSVNEPPPVVFVLDTIVDPLCFGFQTFISIDTAFGGEGGFNPPYIFYVDNGPQTSITGSVPVLAGNHTVTVQDANGCTSEIDVLINQPPPVVVDLGDDIEIELGDSAVITPVIGSALALDSIIWSPLTALTCLDSLCFEISVLPFESQVYELTVIDVNGCFGSDDILVEVDKNRNVYIPNIFSPDGDGTNDIFTVFTGTGVELINSFQVYDRWGESVYSVTTPFQPSDFGNPGWDGFFKGKVMNPGVFVYMIEVQFADGIVLLYRGDVTLLH